MKTLLFLFFATVGFGAVAQRPSYSKHITSDGRQLRIRVDMCDPNQSMHYNRTFEVSHLSRTEVQALERQVLDSLDAVMPPTVTAQRNQPGEGVDYAAQGYSVAMVANSQTPYQKFVEEMPENRLKVRFTFIIDGQENIVERTAIIRDPTERGRQKLQREIERQLTAEMDALTGGSSGV